MSDQVVWAALMRVHIDFYSDGDRYGEEDFVMEIVDPDAAVALALLRAEQSPYFDPRVPHRACLVRITLLPREVPSSSFGS